MEENDFEVKGNGHKKDYTFRYGKARSCDHPNLVLITRGTQMYRCTECNYAHWIQSAITWPLHWVPLMGMMQIGYFVKEFGKEALEQAFREPIGTMDGSEHKPVIPKGKTMMDVLNDLDGFDSLMEGMQERTWELPQGEQNELQAVPGVQADEKPASTRRRKRKPKP